MPPPPILISKAFAGSGLSQVVELLNGTSATQLGVDVPGTVDLAPSGTPASSAPMSGSTKNFNGERFFRGVSSAAGNPVTVHRENEGGAGAWGAVFTAAGATSEGSLSQTGLHVVKDGADTVLCFANTSAGTIRIYKSPTGLAGSWVLTTVSLGGTPLFRGISVTYNNRIYVHDPASARFYEIDPSTGVVSIIVLPLVTSAALAVMGDRLLLLTASDVGGELVHLLYEMGASGFTLNSTLEGPTTLRLSAGTELGQVLLFEDPLDPGKLIAVVNGRRTELASTQGSRVFQGTPSGASFTWVEDTADLTMLAALIPGARGDDDDAVQDRFALFIDSDTNPLVPVAYVIATGGPAPGVIYEMARWEGWLQRMGSGSVSADPGPGASVSTAFSIGHSPLGGGEDLSQGALSYGEIESESPEALGYRLSFRVPGVLGPLTGRVYFDEGQGYPRTLATVVGGLTTFGPITGDNRVTLFTVDVDLALSGITAPDASSWMIDLR